MWDRDWWWFGTYRRDATGSAGGSAGYRLIVQRGPTYMSRATADNEHLDFVERLPNDLHTAYRWRQSTGWALVYRTG